MNKPPRIFLSSPHIGRDELELVKEAFATNWIAPLGPHVDAFEREFVERIRNPLGVIHDSVPAVSALRGRSALVGTSNEQLPTNDASPTIYAAALSSGTAALHLALRLEGVRAGDEVFVSTLTFSASVNPIVYEGAKPVFIDSERRSWNMDPAQLAAALEDRAKKGRLPRAVILVHLYGQSADIDAIADLCQKHNVTLIEDAAEALGASYYTPDRGQGIRDEGKSTDHASRIARRAISPGTRGRMGIFSFNGNKIITTSGGGMLLAAEKGLIDKARFLATQARDPAPHYQHSQIGFNYRMSNVLAAIGRGQLKVLADRVAARRRNCEFYQRAFADLPGITFMPEANWGECTRWLTCILVDAAVFGATLEGIRLALEGENIEARPVWKPMHLQPVFAHCECFGGGVGEDLFNRGLCLPSGSNLRQEDLERVATVVQRCARP